MNTDRINLPKLDRNEVTIGILGMGYVGLPLAVEFAKRYRTVGFDIDPSRIGELTDGKDRTMEVSTEELTRGDGLKFTADAADLAAANVFIVTVPTPIDAHRRPDLEPLEKACHTVGEVLKAGSIVIFESTVFPGATEEVCVPIVASTSGLRFNIDFFAGYSPERINPGDKQHRLTTIKKVTSGSTPEAAEFVDRLYQTIVSAGTHKTSSIRVAEAAKVIENTQRDVNIALVNELAMLFNRLNLDTEEILEAAGTKWNFLPFRPGLVGGHCIGVDPYYLTYKAQQLGYHPEVILAGRRINDGMGAYVAQQVVALMLKRQIHISGARVLVLGLTFKENCPDLRNTKVIDVVNEFRALQAEVDVYDPWVDSEEAQREYGLTIRTPEPGAYDAIIVAVSHRQFEQLGIDRLRAYGKPVHVLYDVKYLFPAPVADGRL